MQLLFMVNLFQSTGYSFLRTARWPIQETLHFSVLAVIFFNPSKGLYNESAFRCFPVTLLYSVAVTRYLRHLKHITHQRKILQGLAKTNAIHISSNFSALTAQTFTRIYLISTLMHSGFVQPFFTL